MGLRGTLGDEVFIHLSINALQQNKAAWGDTQFAQGLAAAIRSIPGCDAGLLYRGEVPPETGVPSVVLRIVGPHLEDPVPGLPNMIWMISPPNLAPRAMMARYQMVFLASALMVPILRRRGIPVAYLSQATDSAHFHPDRADPGAETYPLVFVGGHAARAERHLVQEAVAAGFEPQIWGPGWGGVIPDRLWRGERLNYAELAQVYAASRVILNSHMTQMANLGFMSNRSYDALASGACVLSDHVAGFMAPDLPELRMLGPDNGLGSALEALLAAPPLDRLARLALHERIARRHGFDARAAEIVTAARRLLAEGKVAQPAFSPTRAPLSGPVPVLSDPARSAADTLTAVRAATTEILAISRYLEDPHAPALPPPAPAAADRQGVIHVMMADLREMQQIAALPAALRPLDRVGALAARALRVHEVMQPEPPPLSVDLLPNIADQLLPRILRGEPLWTHNPEGFNREQGKVSLPLWPRKQVPAPAQAPGVFLHLFHDDLAPVFAERLRAIECRYQVYVSTDDPAKAARILAHLPQAEVRVLENRGRDIYPKLYGFGDVYDRHEVVLHLHGKKSPHSGKLDAWLDHILTCLLGSPGEVSRILSLFDAIPRLGMVVPLTYRPVLGAAHWAANREIAQELAFRMGMKQPLPEDADLRFPVGSMFWARTAAIRPLLDLRLTPAQFPPEAGQVDGTVAHALERMLGVTCQAGGYHILPVSGAGQKLHVKHQKAYRSNGALREALDSGAFDA
ncbi:rhamnan synthesis F family protein [Gemmobacter serpentinus]|uniref:rhamnan synthesis F family protein n=1 Tax=Gemmobacter serpentinus TaxID=2652247 RepID=UPI00124D0185|nr:rhamnan synthesis F family protein [Gemmobacter serpentinus]